MLNRKGFELAVSTIVLVVIGLLVLIGLVYLITDGFKKFKGATDPFLENSETVSVREACKLACVSENEESFCKKEHSFSGRKVKCEEIYELYDLQSCEIDCKE